MKGRESANGLVAVAPVARISLRRLLGRLVLELLVVDGRRLMRRRGLDWRSWTGQVALWRRMSASQTLATPWWSLSWSVVLREIPRWVIAGGKAPGCDQFLRKVDVL